MLENSSSTDQYYATKYRWKTWNSIVAHDHPMMVVNGELAVNIWVYNNLTESHKTTSLDRCTETPAFGRQPRRPLWD